MTNFNAAHKQVVYIDFGISNGMQIGIQRFNVDRPKTEHLQRLVEYRSLRGIWATWGRLAAR